MHGGSYCHRDVHHLDLSPPPNGSQVLSLALRLLALALALASAIEMLTSTDCGSTAAAAAAGYTRYSAFVYLAGSNIAVTILQAVAIILQALLLAKAGTDPDMDACTDHLEEKEERQLPEVLSMAIDVLTLALLFSATGAAYATSQMGACPRFAEQVTTAKALSLGAGAGAALAVVLKHMKLPFNILPPA